MKNKNKLSENLIEGIFLILGLITVGCVLLITVYLIITGIPAIKRNNQVEIEAIISRETAVDVNVTLRWEVQDWNSVNVNVPSFD